MSSTTIDKTKKVGITLPILLTKQTDKLRGDVKRSTYIRRAIENYLKQGNMRISQNPKTAVVSVKKLSV
jgi:metal-responsive CopG/Arc/MetJ family transcriptional regulator